MERGCNSGVHIDQHVLLGRDELVPRLDSLPDPIDEGLSDYGRAHVADPLLRRLPQLLLVRHEEDHVLMLHKEIEDLFHLQGVVGRYMYMNNLAHRHISFPTFNQVLEEVDREGMECRKVRLDVDRQEGEDFFKKELKTRWILTSFAPKLG